MYLSISVKTHLRDDEFINGEDWDSGSGLEHELVHGSDGFVYMDGVYIRGYSDDEYDRDH